MLYALCFVYKGKCSSRKRTRAYTHFFWSRFDKKIHKRPQKHSYSDYLSPRVIRQMATTGTGSAFTYMNIGRDGMNARHNVFKVHEIPPAAYFGSNKNFRQGDICSFGLWDEAADEPVAYPFIAGTGRLLLSAELQGAHRHAPQGLAALPGGTRRRRREGGHQGGRAQDRASAAPLRHWLQVERLIYVLCAL